MEAIFIAPMTNGTPDIPPFESDDGGVQLYYTDGVLKGGFAVVSYIPSDQVILKIIAPETTIDDMKLDDKYLWLEDIVEVIDVV